MRKPPVCRGTSRFGSIRREFFDRFYRKGTGGSPCFDEGIDSTKKLGSLNTSICTGGNSTFNHRELGLLNCPAASISLSTCSCPVFYIFPAYPLFCLRFLPQYRCLFSSPPDWTQSKQATAEPAQTRSGSSLLIGTGEPCNLVAIVAV